VRANLLRRVERQLDVYLFVLNIDSEISFVAAVFRLLCKSWCSGREIMENKVVLPEGF
jgi:hypothetical protein